MHVTPARHLLPTYCPLCQPTAPSPLTDRDQKCQRCGHFSLSDDLLHRIDEIPDRHLVGGYTREHWDTNRKSIELEDSNLDGILAQCPRNPLEKADKLLLAIQRKTDYFGHVVTLEMEDDYPLGYAKNCHELFALLEYLLEAGFMRSAGTFSPTSFKCFAAITSAGYEVIESRLLSPTLTIFLSSTCHDLLDLRAELADFLDSKGLIVNVSDDPYRIDIEPTEDSIQTCLRNVETADVIVCILDGRYGPTLPPDHKFSATHAEVNRARDLGRPIYIFGRDKALADYDQLRRDENAKTLWVEKSDDGQRKKWLAFAKDLQGLAYAQRNGHSNWVDPFRDSVQLKKLVLKRLGDYQRKLPDSTRRS